MFADFSTDTVAPADRFQLWRDSFGSVHDVEVEPHLRAAFTASGRSWRLGPVIIGEFATPARRIVRSRSQVKRDDLDHIYLRVALDEPAVCILDQERLIARTDEVHIGTYANSYDVTFAAGRWVTAVLDRAAFPAFWGWSGTAQQLKGSSASLLAGFLGSLPKALGAMDAQEEPHVAEAVCATISALLASCPSLDLAVCDPGQIRLRLAAQRIIATELASSRLTPARVAELAGVSRSTLYRAFEAEGGIAQYVLRRRLHLVRRDLVAPSLERLSIAEIAERRGLHNAASFHSMFRQQFGETPGAFRASARFPRHSDHVDGLPIQPATPRQFLDLLLLAAREDAYAS